MNVEAAVTLVAMVVVAVCCTIAVLAESYHDTVLQRVALAGMAIGACAVSAWAARCMTVGEDSASDPAGAVAWFAASCAVFALETLRKVYFRRRSGVWTNEQSQR
jgi:hypothetical protein